MSKNEIPLDIPVETPEDQFRIPRLKIKISDEPKETPPKTKKIKVIKYGGIICSFSMDPEYKKTQKKPCPH